MCGSGNWGASKQDKDPHTDSHAERGTSACGDQGADVMETTTATETTETASDVILVCRHESGHVAHDSLLDPAAASEKRRQREKS